jgi:YVTN family beta-propeller protein
MHHRLLPSATPALVSLIVSFLCSGLTPAPAGAHALALSQDGHHLYFADPAGSLDVLDPETNAPLTRMPLQGVSFGASLAVSPDGRLLYAAGSLLSPPLLVIDLAAGKVVDGILVGVFEGERESLVTDLAVSPDGSRLYVLAENPHSFSVVDTASDKVIAALPLFGVSEALTPDGKKLYIANGAAGANKGGVVSVFDTSTNQVTGTVSVPSGPGKLAASPDGSRIYVGGSDGVTVIDTTSDRIDNRNYPLPGGGSSLAVSPDGSRLYWLPFELNVVAGIDTTKSQVLGSVGVGVSPFDLVVSPAGAYVYVLNRSQPGSPDGSLSVVDAYGSAFRVLETIDLTRAPVR